MQQRPSLPPLLATPGGRSMNDPISRHTLSPHMHSLCCNPVTSAGYSGFQGSRETLLLYSTQHKFHQGIEKSKDSLSSDPRTSTQSYLCSPSPTESERHLAGSETDTPLSLTTFTSFLNSGFKNRNFIHGIRCLA